ncbi:hypothetical protein SCLCIDRAFT_911669 [Scleroderma citrinum Foug A]|uniref:Serine-threonine/tyrosine-protein kinase catalytic domain-containing protein n=1 Tax=Scleroderma citrinum Foug A TaxID=1036808 RepID=A0A0C2ZHX9_9AGAM|nr:hypothetical protein SCLCIDRAFT_911669 [Scleroderma citrinum Foug A]
MIQIVVHITQGPLPTQPAHMADDWWDLCTACWERQPACRPTMSTLVEQIKEVGVLIFCCGERTRLGLSMMPASEDHGRGQQRFRDEIYTDRHMIRSYIIVIR